MSIYLGINGTQITNFIISTPFKDTIDEELDNFNFQIKSETRLTYKKNDRVVYSLSQGNTTILQKVFCIFNVVETWEGEKWLYQISCLSPTKLLENIIINGMADTYASVRLDLQLDRVREKINAQLGFEMAVAPVLSFDSSISPSNQTLYNALPSDFLWDNQVNVREIFNDMLDKVDMICIGTNFTIDANGNITAITIGAEKREKKGTKLIESANDIDNGGLEDVSEMVKGITFNRNSEFACGNIISLIKNGIAKDNVQQAYLPARNTDLTIDEASEWHLITQEPIYSLNKVEILANIYNCGMRVYENGSTKYTIYGGITVVGKFDITNYIVEKSVFDAMSLSQQSKHLYFVRGQKGIFGLYKRYKSGLTGLFSNTAIENIIGDITTNEVLNVHTQTPLSQASFYDENYFGYFTKSGNSYTTYTKETSNTQITGNANYQNNGSVADITPENIYYGLNWNNETTSPSLDDAKSILFSINYQPYCDSVVKIERTNIADIEANSKNLSIIKNQSDRTVDAEKYFNSQQSLINRMGNKEMFIDCIVDLSQTYSHLKSLWDLGDYMVLNSKTWTITQREFTNYNETTLKIRYTLSKDYNGSNVDIQVNRDKRLYGINKHFFISHSINKALL